MIFSDKWLKEGKVVFAIYRAKIPDHNFMQKVGWGEVNYYNSLSWFVCVFESMWVNLFFCIFISRVED